MARHSTKSMGSSWWSAQITAWEQSGLSRAKFCESRGLNLSTFQKWRQRLQSIEKVKSSALMPHTSAPRFIAVEVPAQAPLVRVSVGSVTVDFDTLPPPAWVAELASYGGR